MKTSNKDKEVDYMPHKDPARRRECGNAWQNKQRSLRIKNGLCPRCGKQAEPEKTRCERCANIERQKQSAYYHRLMNAALAAYGLVCKCCKEDRREFLAVDHVYGGGNQDRKSKGGQMGMLIWLKHHNYPIGLQVLCHNCNWAKFAYGECPHERERRLRSERPDHQESAGQ